MLIRDGLLLLLLLLLPLIDRLPDLCANPLLHLLLFHLSSLDGTHEAGSLGELPLVPGHVDQRGSCHPGHLLLFPSIQA